MGRKIAPEGKKKRTVEKIKMTMQSRQRGHAHNIDISPFDPGTYTCGDG